MNNILIFFYFVFVILRNDKVFFVEKKKRFVVITFALRPYVVTLKNGTIVMVSTVPHSMPPIRPTICCCQGNVPMAKMQTARKINFISAMCGRFNCLQWIIINSTAIEETTPAIDANGPT